MFENFLNQFFTVTRTSTITNPVTHIAKTTTRTIGPFSCRIGRANGNIVQTSPQAVYTQSLRLYAVIEADVKAGDIITVDNIKYTVGNPYKPANHHIECDITLKQEV